jgi:fucose permease
MKNDRSKALIILYFIFFVFGIAESAIDPLTPVISKEINVGFDIIGIVLFVSFFFLVAANFISGRLSDHHDTKKIIIAGLLLIFSGLLVFGIYITFILFIVTMIFARSGFGVIDSSIYAYVCQFFSKRRSEIFVRLNLLWYIGCVTGTLIISILLFSNIKPRLLFVFIAALFLITALFFLKMAPSKNSQISIETKTPKKRQGFLQIIRFPVIILSSVILFFYAGAIFGLSTWLTTYFISFNVEVFIGSAVLSGYWMFSIIGLLITNFLIRRFKEVNILIIGYLVGAISIILVTFVPQIYIKIVFLMIQGLALSCVFPLVKSIPIDENPDASGTIVGFLLTIQGAGIMIFQLIIGVVAENLGVESIISIIMSSLLIGLILTIALFVVLKRKKLSILTQIQKQ